MSWRDFWNREHSIYVNDRHRALHDDRVSKGIASLVESPDWTVLDFGCGEATAAGVVAERCARLYLSDGAPNVVQHLRERFAGNPRVVVLPSEGLTDMPDAAADLVVVNSVIQYMPRTEFEALLDLWRGKLKPGGKLVVADVISPDTSTLTDIGSLLRFAWEGGFLMAALGGLVATFFSDYRKLRAQIGLSRYTEAEMEALLVAHGFSCRRAPQNIGHDQGRMMFEARRN